MSKEKVTEEVAKEEVAKVCADRSGYVKTRTATGKVSLRSDDPVAGALEGLTLDETYKVCAKMTGMTIAALHGGDGKKMKGYDHLNVGMQRMSLGNRIRGAIGKDLKSKEPTGLAEKLIDMTTPIQERLAKKAEIAAKKAEIAAVKKDKENEAKKAAEAKKKAA